MADTSRALILRFGADTGALRGALSALAAEAPRHLTAIGQAAVVNSSLLRNSLISAGAEGTRTVSAQLLGLARDTDHLRLAANLAGEGVKTAFALHHPVLAIGLKLLSDYKIQLGLIAAGAITAHEAFKIMGDQFDRVNQIIEGSMKAGVSSTVFQAWTDQAARFGLTAQEAAAALEHVGTVARKEISAEQIGPLMRAADELQNGLNRPTAAYGLIREATTSDDIHHAALVLVEDYLKAADAMRGAGQEAKGVRLEIEAGNIAAQAWGDSAYKIVDAIKSGRADIEHYVQTSREAGYVWGEDIVNAQKESNEMLRIAQERLSNEMAPTMRGLAAAAIGFQNIWVKIVEKIADAAAWVNKIESMLGTAKVIQPFNEETFNALGDPKKFPLTAGLRNLAAENAPGEPGPRYLAVDAPSPPRRPSQRQLEAPSLGHEHSGSSGGSAARESLDQVERLVQSFEKENAALQGEADAIGKSSVEREKSIDLAKAEEAAKERGSALTEEERTKVLALAEAHATLRKKVDDARKAQEAADAARKQFADMGESSVERLIVEHQKLADVLKEVVKELEKMALKAVLTGQGPLAGLFGTAGQNGGVGGLFGLLASGGGSGGSSGGGFGGGLLGLLGGLFKFADGGLITMAHLPRYAGGGPVAPDGGFPILAHPGEVVLNAAQQRNVAGAIGGQGSKIVFENHAPGTTIQRVYPTHGEVRYMIQSELAVNNERQSLAPLQAW